MIYTVFAGVNGAGKSSTYGMLSEFERISLGVRLNVDERVAELGDWRDDTLQIRCAREILKEVNDCIRNNISFNQETTLSGMTTVKKIIEAKQKGFVVHLYYVFIESPELAIQRIKGRVSRGGHGISDDIVRRRFYESLENLKLVIPYCNKVHIYDNTERFKLVIVINDGEIDVIDKSFDVKRIFR